MGGLIACPCTNVHIGKITVEEIFFHHGWRDILFTFSCTDQKLLGANTTYDTLPDLGRPRLGIIATPDGFKIGLITSNGILQACDVPTYLSAPTPVEVLCRMSCSLAHERWCHAKGDNVQGCQRFSDCQ